MPWAWFSHRNQSATSSMRGLALLVFLVHFDEERARLDAPLLFECEELAALVPVDRDGPHVIAPRSLELGKRDGDRPGLLVLRLERHLVIRPFRVAAGQRRFEQRAVEQERDARAALQRVEGLRNRRKHDQLGTVELRHPSIVIGAFGGADFLALELLPIRQLRRFLGQHIGAARIVVGLDHADDIAALRRIAHRRDDQIDATLLKELHAVRTGDGHQLELYAEAIGNVLGEVDLHADGLTAGIYETPRLVVVLDADDQRAALLYLGERILGGDWCGAGRSERQYRAENDKDLLEHLLFPHPMVKSARAMPPAFYSGRISPWPLATRTGKPIPPPLRIPAACRLMALQIAETRRARWKRTHRGVAPSRCRHGNR